MDGPRDSEETVSSTASVSGVSGFGEAELNRVSLGLDFSQQQLLLDEDAGYLYAWRWTKPLRIFDLDGNLIIQTEVGGPNGLKHLVAEGDDVFIVTGRTILRFRMPDLELVDTIDRPSSQNGDRPAITGGRFWYTTYPGNNALLHSYDLETGETTDYPGVVSGLGLTRMDTARDVPNRLLVKESILLDTSQSPPVIVQTELAGELISVNPDGRMFRSREYPDPPGYREYSMIDGTLTRTMLPTHGFAPSTVVPGQNVAFRPYGETGPDGKGITTTWDTTTGLRIGRFAAEEIAYIRAFRDLSRALVVIRDEGYHMLLVDLAPRVTAFDKALYRPDLSTKLQLDALLLGPDIDVRVNGQVRPHVLRFQKNVLSVELDSADSSPDGEIVITTQWGQATTVLPGVPPRGMSAVVMHLDAVLTPTQVLHLLRSEEVFCRRDDGMRWESDLVWMRDTVAIALIPTHVECSVRPDNGRLGFLASDGPHLPAPDPLTRAEFLSGGVIHLGLRVRANEFPLWVYTSVVGGDAAAGAALFAVVTCPDWSIRQPVAPNGGTRFLIPPDDYPDIADTRACTVSVDGLPAAAVFSSDSADGTGDRTIAMTERVPPTFVSFRMDLGGFDRWASNIVGSPGEDLGAIADAGVVQIFPVATDGTFDVANATFIWQGKDGLFGAAEAGDRFGEAIARGDFNDDGWLDIAIGAPGEGVGPRDNAGMVSVLFGSRAGYVGSSSTHLHQNVPGVPGVAEAGDRFGEALTVADYNGDFVDDLIVGVPGEGIGSLNDAGLVHVFYGSRQGLSGANSEMISQATPGVFGNVEAGDEFGAALDADLSYLVIGSPGEDIGAVVDAGMFHYIDGLTYESEAIWQGHRSHGLPEPFDRFGEVFELVDGQLWVGVPLEDVGPVVDAGMVFVFDRTIGRPELIRPHYFDQDYEGTIFDHRVGPADRFGASLDSFVFGDGRFMLMGAPGEADDRGFVHLVNLGGAGFDWNYWTQERLGLNEQSEPGDRFGETAEFGWGGSLVVASPGEDAGSGAVFTTADGVAWLRISQGSGGVGGAPEAGDEFGGSFE